MGVELGRRPALGFCDLAFTAAGCLADGSGRGRPANLTPHPVLGACGRRLSRHARGRKLSYADGPGPAVAWFPLAPGEMLLAELYRRSRLHPARVEPRERRGFERDPHSPGTASRRPEIVNGHFANREFAVERRPAPGVCRRPAGRDGAAGRSPISGCATSRRRSWRSPQIGPPPRHLVRVAAAGPGRDPSTHPRAAAKGRVGPPSFAPPRSARAISRIPPGCILVRLRVLTYGEISRLRHSTVLRVARSIMPHRIPKCAKRLIRR